MGIETIIGGAVGLIGSSMSSSAMENAAAQQAEVQKYIFDTTVALQQPFLNTGYAANNELAALYGLAPPIPATGATNAQANPYTQAATVPASGDVYGQTQQSTGQTSAPPGFTAIVGPDGQPTGIYQNVSGQVYDPSINYTDAIQNPENYWNDPYQTGDTYDYVQSIQPLAGFQQSQALNALPPAPGTGGNGEPGMTSAEQQQAAIERFYQSPEYTLMYEPAVQYGTEALDRAASASGSVLSGAQSQALAGYAGDLASQTYGNYVNQLNSMSGYGQTAAGNIQTAGQNYATGAGNAYMNAGQAQAAGYMGMTNTALDAMNAYSMPAYGSPYGGYSSPSYSAPMASTGGTNYLPTDNFTIGYYG